MLFSEALGYALGPLFYKKFSSEGCEVPSDLHYP